MTEKTFVEWLQSELDSRGWRPIDLIKKSGIDSGLLSKIQSGERRPGLDTCRAIARAFSMRDVDVLRIAGLIDEKPPHDENAENLLVEFYKLSDEDRRFVLDQIRGLRRIREEQGRYEARS